MRTINSAFAMRQEDSTGSLTVGKDADFIIVDNDLFELEAQQDYAGIRNTQVLNTVLEGEEIWRPLGTKFQHGRH